MKWIQGEGVCGFVTCCEDTYWQLTSLGGRMWNNICITRYYCQILFMRPDCIIVPGNRPRSCKDHHPRHICSNPEVSCSLQMGQRLVMVWDSASKIAVKVTNWARDQELWCCSSWQPGWWCVAVCDCSIVLLPRRPPPPYLDIFKIRRAPAIHGHTSSPELHHTHLMILKRPTAASYGSHLRPGRTQKYLRTRKNIWNTTATDVWTASRCYRKNKYSVHVIMTQLVLRGLKFAKYWLSEFADHYH